MQIRNYVTMNALFMHICIYSYNVGTTHNEKLTSANAVDTKKGDLTYPLHAVPS